MLKRFRTGGAGRGTSSEVEVSRIAERAGGEKAGQGDGATGQPVPARPHARPSSPLWRVRRRDGGKSKKADITSPPADRGAGRTGWYSAAPTPARIDAVVMEARSREYVEHAGRRRLEQGNVTGRRWAWREHEREGLVHEGVEMVSTSAATRIEFHDWTGRGSLSTAAGGREGMTRRASTRRPALFEVDDAPGGHRDRRPVDALPPRREEHTLTCTRSRAARIPRRLPRHRPEGCSLPRARVALAG